QIEVLTSKKQTPNPDWMSFVVTHKARTRIRHWINEKRRKAVDHGRALVEKRMKRVGLSVDKQTLERVTAQLKFPSTQQLYYEIGSGLYDAAEFVDQLRNRSTPEPEPEAGASPARLEVEQIAEGFTEVAREHGSPSLIIDGEAQSGMAVEYATCCSPIPGDEVFGFISKTGAIKIHRTSCKNAPHLLLDRAERTIDVEWSRQKDVQFVAALRIVGEDRVGLVSDLTTVISKNLKTNIRSITIAGEDGMFEGIVGLYVSDLGQLQRIMKRINRLDGVYGVYRLEE
ncbi:MAG: ACT domain-containing protein, partial [Bacteroidota bacterium]